MTTYLANRLEEKVFFSQLKRGAVQLGGEVMIAVPWGIWLCFIYRYKATEQCKAYFLFIIQSHYLFSLAWNGVTHIEGGSYFSPNSILKLFYRYILNFFLWVIIDTVNLTMNIQYYKMAGMDDFLGFLPLQVFLYNHFFAL